MHSSYFSSSIREQCIGVSLKPWRGTGNIQSNWEYNNRKRGQGSIRASVENRNQNNQCESWIEVSFSVEFHAFLIINVFFVELVMEVAEPQKKIKTQIVGNQQRIYLPLTFRLTNFEPPSLTWSTSFSLSFPALCPPRFHCYFYVSNRRENRGKWESVLNRHAHSLLFLMDVDRSVYFTRAREPLELGEIGREREG